MVTSAPSTAAPVGADQDLLERLRAGDEASFADVLRRWSPAMLRLAKNFVSTNQSAEDAVQDAWLGMLDGLSRFEGRAALRTWTFSILVNRAKSRGIRENRTVVKLQAPDNGGTGRATVDPERFQGPDGPYPRPWSSSREPAPWHQPQQRAVAQETLSVVEQALEALPERQRSVVTMRDVQGFSGRGGVHRPGPNAKEPADSAAPGARGPAGPSGGLLPTTVPDLSGRCLPDAKARQPGESGRHAGAAKITS